MRTQGYLAVCARMRDEEDVLPWWLANLAHADAIFLLDVNSQDNSYDVAARAAEKDKRIVLGRYPEQVGWYEDEWRQANAQFDLGAGYECRWWQYQDVDEISNITIQSCLRDWLYRNDPGGSVGVAMRFLYLAPGWREYYAEPSRWPDQPIWSYRPRFRTTDIGGRQAETAPAAIITAPDEYQTLHFNWAMEVRFARKRPIYEKRFGGPSWHPDEKYPQRESLLSEARWYAPDGTEVGFEDMPKYNLR